jgi:hypothetical protein
MRVGYITRALGCVYEPKVSPCLHHDLTLLTTNPRHFERIPDLVIVSDPGSFATL